MKARPRKDLLAVVLSLLVLAGAAADRVSLIPPTDPTPYHARVRAAADAAPKRVGDWVASDVPVPADATACLRPNVLLNREFRNVVTGQRVGFLLVQCWDVRDLLPHFPPICYPGRGLSLMSAAPKDWNADDLKLTGTEYEFESNLFRSANLTVVDNFMVVPNGAIARDMKQVKELVPMRDRYFGGAQVQMVFDGTTPAEERDRIFDTLIGAHRPLIEAVRKGW